MIKIDAIGRKILRELSRDGRISNLELADRVGLSPSACLRRVQELERHSLVEGFVGRRHHHPHAADADDLVNAVLASEEVPCLYR